MSRSILPKSYECYDASLNEGLNHLIPDQGRSHDLDQNTWRVFVYLYRGLLQALQLLDKLRNFKYYFQDKLILAPSNDFACRVWTYCDGRLWVSIFYCGLPRVFLQKSMDFCLIKELYSLLQTFIAVKLDWK
jgi:hypothetical protein